MRILLLLAISAVYHQASAFLPSSVNVGMASLTCSYITRGSQSGFGCDASTESFDGAKSVAVTRKSFFKEAIKASVGISVASSLPIAPSPVLASGGATAGGAYLLSAKQRYNQRVIAGVKAFLSLDARDLSKVDAFFTTPDEGGWEDLSSAGYLLANAFRTSSTKAPDNLPSVKKWKAFSKDMELVKKALAKKDGEKVFAAYKVAEEKLDPYLEEVELTSLVR